EKRPPVHVRPTDMPEQLQEQAELQLKVLSVVAAAKEYADTKKAHKKQNKQAGKKKSPAAQTDNGVKKDMQNKKTHTKKAAAETPAAAADTTAAAAAEGKTKKPDDLSSSWLSAAAELRRAQIPIPESFHGERASFTAHIPGTDSKATIQWYQGSIYVKRSHGCKDEKVNVDLKGGSTLSENGSPAIRMETSIQIDESGWLD
ncbi:unnamed protein product, partial [Symbiodinium sp. KB8]